MKIIMSQQCESLTGSLGSGFGYHIERRKNGFFSKRNQRGIIPRDGHWRFIVACAELAQNRLHITDIEVRSTELAEAFMEAGLMNNIPAYFGWCEEVFYNARDILNLKTTFSL